MKGGDRELECNIVADSRLVSHRGMNVTSWHVRLSGWLHCERVHLRGKQLSLVPLNTAITTSVKYEIYQCLYPLLALRKHVPEQH